MAGRFPFKHDRFPREIVLCPVRWYLRYPLSYQDVVDLLAERGVSVDRSTVYRWVQTQVVSPGWPLFQHFDQVLFAARLPGVRPGFAPGFHPVTGPGLPVPPHHPGYE